MNSILKRSGSALFRLLLRQNKPPLPLQTATRSFFHRSSQLPAEVSCTAAAPIRGLFRHQWPAVQPTTTTLLLQHYFTIFARRQQRPELIHFARRRGGGLPWYLSWEKLLARVLVPAAAAYAVYRSCLQTVPYTHRRRAVVLPPRYERKLGESVFALHKEALLSEGDDKILPPDHADTVRVRRIADEIIGTAERALIAPRRNGEELLDDESGGQPRPMTKHLVGLDWEVIVVKDNEINACCLPGGKILVNTGFLEHFKTDAEIAAVLGHEVGHVIARHTAEDISKGLFLALVRISVVRLVFDNRHLVRALSSLLFKLPFSRKMEIEADHIGIMLLAAAGFDPHAALEAHKKLGEMGGESELQNYLSTHPSGTKRVQNLSQDKVMHQAMELYREATARKTANDSGFSNFSCSGYCSFFGAWTRNMLRYIC